MAMQNPHPINEVQVSGQLLNVSSTSTVSMRAPFQGRILKVGTTLGSAASTADATATFKVNGTAITTGVVTITQSGSAQGSTFSAVPTAANLVNEDDSIDVTVAGSGTAGGPVAVWAVVRRGTI